MDEKALRKLGKRAEFALKDLIEQADDKLWVIREGCESLYAKVDSPWGGQVLIQINLPPTP